MYVIFITLYSTIFSRKSPPYNTKEYYMGDFFIHLRAKSYEINV